jgi:hypothetical protein|tara:strand:+ start:891 stop:1691 length:801 start_codon:yes stop_codon:yes gene_type:complete
MLGLILGDTKFGSQIIEKLRSKKKKFIIIDISKRKIHKGKNSFAFSIGQLGKAISILKHNKCKEVIFAGRVSMPNFKNIKFDLKALYYLPRIIKNSKKGDVYLIKEIIKIFNKEGFKVINSLKFNSELIARKKTYTKTKIRKLEKKDIKKAMKLISSMRNSKTGQAIVIDNGFVLSIEGSLGTDHMLNKLEKKNKNKKTKKGVLVKLPKKNQDLRIDLPTIGLKTIKKSIKIGLKGIAVKANQSVFLEKQKSIRLANKHRIFICGI